MILDFKEIPQANKGGGLQDTFELFARDYLAYLGFKIVEDPDRGADGKRDLIVEEYIQGIATEFKFRWLVSCKHYAHSGNAVKDTDEPNILERLKQHKCDGFMAVYSTLCATSLGALLKGLKEDGTKIKVFDHEQIEQKILGGDIEGLRLCARYMPISYKNYQLEHPGLSDVFSKNDPILCDCCGKDLLVGDNYKSVYVLLSKQLENDKGEIDRTSEDMYFACKGDCDTRLKHQYAEEGLFDNGWDDLRDLTIPTIWINKFIAFVNGIYNSKDIKEPAFSKMKQMFIRTYPYVARCLTSREKERVKSLMEFGLLH